MWPFTKKRHSASRLTGVSDRLWSYDARHHRGWRLDTESPSADRRLQPRDRRSLRGTLRQDKLGHFIGAGGMRHESRVRAARKNLIERQDLVWRLFIAYLLAWIAFRWLPW